MIIQDKLERFYQDPGRGGIHRYHLQPAVGQPAAPARALPDDHRLLPQPARLPGRTARSTGVTAWPSRVCSRATGLRPGAGLPIRSGAWALEASTTSSPRKPSRFTTTPRCSSSRRTALTTRRRCAPSWARSISQQGHPPDRPSSAGSQPGQPDAAHRAAGRAAAPVAPGRSCSTRTALHNRFQPLGVIAWYLACSCWV